MTDAHEIEVLECIACGTLDPGPRELCAQCAGREFRLRSVPGRGTLVSSTVIRKPATAFRSEGPFEVAVVDLDAGVRITGRLMPGTEAAPGERVAMTGRRGDIAFFVREEQ